MKWYRDFWPWFCASHVDQRILVALDELAGIMKFRFTVPEHNCLYLWSALCVFFFLNTIVIRVRTSKRLILVDVPFITFLRVVLLCYDYWGHLFRFTTAHSFLFFCGSYDYRFPRIFLCLYCCLIWIVSVKRIQRNESSAWRWRTMKESVNPHLVTQCCVNWFVWKYSARTVSLVMFHAVYILRLNNYYWIWCTGVE